ncbi:hypothetical protein L905_11765 [Agrobacterium sp. TS43]|nr:hypothetical protein L906_22110 [Agrobacterium sp. TS45]KVK66316.1 hypothetical protein L907_22070 [Agrobacterium sp. C13]KVK70214.1 hypothetical protein L905_11765 [Agrobacterium sp. TS43]
MSENKPFFSDIQACVDVSVADRILYSNFGHMSLHAKQSHALAKGRRLLRF